MKRRPGQPVRAVALGVVAPLGWIFGVIALVTATAIAASAAIAGVALLSTKRAGEALWALRPTRVRGRRLRARLRLRLGIALTAIGLVGAAMAPATLGDLWGPDETPAGAVGPLDGGVTYAKRAGAPAEDRLYYFFTSRPGVTLRFTISNTVSSCPAPSIDRCPVWLTLLSIQGRQLGGEGSTAGTGRVEPGSSEQVEWTFRRPGKYVIVVESGGDAQSFSMRIDPAAGVTTTPPVPFGPAPLASAEFRARHRAAP